MLGLDIDIAGQLAEPVQRAGKKMPKGSQRQQDSPQYHQYLGHAYLLRNGDVSASSSTGWNMRRYWLGVSPVPVVLERVGAQSAAA